MLNIHVCTKARVNYADSFYSTLVSSLIVPFSFVISTIDRRLFNSSSQRSISPRLLASASHKIAIRCAHVRAFIFAFAGSAAGWGRPGGRGGSDGSASRACVPSSLISSQIKNSKPDNWPWWRRDFSPIVLLLYLQNLSYRKLRNYLVIIHYWVHLFFMKFIYKNLKNGCNVFAPSQDPLAWLMKPMHDHQSSPNPKSSCSARLSARKGWIFSWLQTTLEVYHAP